MNQFLVYIFILILIVLVPSFGSFLLLEGKSFSLFPPNSLSGSSTFLFISLECQLVPLTMIPSRFFHSQCYHSLEKVMKKFGRRKSKEGQGMCAWYKLGKKRFHSVPGNTIWFDTRRTFILPFIPITLRLSVYSFRSLNLLLICSHFFFFFRSKDRIPCSSRYFFCLFTGHRHHYA